MTEVERLAIPDLLTEGRWAHSFIVTYNADLRFYETDIWSRLSARNCVVLVDAELLCEAASQAGRLRHANVRYVLEPIGGSTSAHAKLIWLSNSEEGLLLVGSGNLTTTGYAGDGELFTAHRWTNEGTGDVAAFQSVRDFLDALVDRGHVAERVRPHLNRAWSESPWLHRRADAERAVRHNLEEPFLDQLVEQVAGRPVKSLIVHAPFHDERCEALRRCVEALSPSRVEALVQDGETSVDPGALRSVLDGYGKPWQVRAARGPSPSTYLHAKFVLVRLGKSEVCLQGSPNLSLAALTLTPPQGNIELANLLEGSEGSFVHVIDALTTQPSDPSELRLSFRGGDEEETEQPVWLVRGTLIGAELVIELDRQVPEGAQAHLLIAGDIPAGVDLTIIEREVRAALPEPLAARLAGRVRPVSLRIVGPRGDYDTNPIYPSQSAELDKLLVGQTDAETLRKIGQVDLGVDEDISSVLSELADALPLDRRSLWRTIRPAETTDADAPRVSWEEIDWDTVRRHPVLAQYQALAAGRVEPTDLQLLLAAAEGVLPNLRPGPSDQTPAGLSLDPDEEDLDADQVDDEEDLLTDEEIAEREAERERRRQSVQQRNRNAWLRFFKRLLGGLEDEEFIAVIGPVTAVTNAVLANRLMTLLVARSHLTAVDLLHLQFRLWRLLWHPGPLKEGPDPEESHQVDTVLSDHLAAVHTVAGLFLAERGTASGDWADERIALRELWRALLASEHDVDTAAADQAAELAGTAAETLIDSLWDLAWETYDSEVLAAVAGVLHVSEHSVQWRIERVTVRGKPSNVPCLVVQGEVELDVETANRLLDAWFRVEPERGYWRCQTSSGPVVRDAITGEAWWWDRDVEDFVELEPSDSVDDEWVFALKALKLYPQARVS